MTNEEFDRRFERHVEFSLQQQANFDARMDRLEAAQAKTEQTMDRAAKNISHLAGFIHEGFGLIQNLFKDTDAKIQALVEEHRLTEEGLQKLTARMDRHLSDDHGLEN